MFSFFLPGFFEVILIKINENSASEYFLNIPNV